MYLGKQKLSVIMFAYLAGTKLMGDKKKKKDITAKKKCLICSSEEPGVLVISRQEVNEGGDKHAKAPHQYLQCRF